MLLSSLETVDSEVVHSEGVSEEHPQQGLVRDHLLDDQGEHDRHVHRELEHEVPRENRE